MNTYVMGSDSDLRGQVRAIETKTPRAWERVQDIPAGVKARDKDGDPVQGGCGLLNAKLIEFENQFAPFTEVLG